MLNIPIAEGETMRHSKYVAGLAILTFLGATGQPRAETRVLFTAKSGDNSYQLYSVGTSGAGLRQHTTNSGMVWAPALYPDGTNVVYLSTDDAAGGNIRISNLDGTGDRPVNSTYPALSAQWYDTNTLFYTRSTGGTYPYPYELWQIDTDGGGESKVFTNTFMCWPMGRRNFHIDRTRDEVYLTSFISPGTSSRIMVGRPGVDDSPTPLPVQSPLMLNSDHYTPAVSLDGTNVIYCADFGRGAHRPYMGKADGSGFATLLMNTNCGSTSWSPAGDRVAFTWNPSNSTYGSRAYVGDIVIMDPTQPTGTNEITSATPVGGTCAFPTIYEAQETPTVVPPTIRNEPASNVVTQTGADIYVELVSTGGAPTHVSLYWGQAYMSTNEAQWDTKVDLGFRGEGVHKATVSIETNRQYWYRAQCTNLAGVGWSPTSTVFGYASPAPVPFNEIFDPNPLGQSTASRLGPLDYQNGWRSSAIEGAVVQDNVAHGGNQSVRLNGSSMTRTFTRDSTNVWVQTYAKVTPSGLPTNIPPDATSVFWFNGNGNVVAYDGVNARTMNDTVFPLDDWLRVVSHSDYVNRKWSLWVDNTNVLADFNFFSTHINSFASVSVVQSSTNAAYVDDIRVATSSPGSLIQDADGDRMADVWERRNFDNDLRTAGLTTDFDLDGFLDLREFLADTSPTDSGSLLQIRDITPRGNGRYEIGFDTVSSRNYEVYTSTNVIPASWEAHTPSPIQGSIGMTTYTVTVDQASQKLYIRVGAHQP